MKVLKVEIKERIKKINRGEVPEGYKKTRLGIIPEDWEVKKLGELLEFKNGINAKKEDYGHGIKFINVLDILNNNYIVYNNIIGKVNVDKKKLENYDVCYGDILFQRSSETIEEVGHANVYLDNKVATFGGFVIRGKKTSNYEPLFLKELLNSSMSRRQIESGAGGSTRFNIGQTELYKVKLFLPHLSEQQKISQILSTWDKAIELKEKIIKEKQEQKKGLVQKLLTGEVRLAGFDGEWEEVKLKEVGEIVTGTTPSTKTNGYYEGGTYPWITPTDITENKYISVSERNLTEEGLKRGRFLPEGSLLITCIASIGKNAILTVDGSCNQQINAIITNKNFSNEFLYYLIGFHTDYLKSYAGKSATEIINKKTFENLKFKLPPLQEQKAIAQILSTADKEIDLLNQELEELKLQKKGLMQLLLTGIVRVKY